jgi:hypothetical protein
MRKYLAIREKNMWLAQAKTRPTSAKILESALESQENGEKIFYGQGTLFIGVNPPRFDRCEIPGGRVSTLTFQGWRFLPEFEDFVESDRQSQPASPRG